jgi:hypothetical protein
MQGQVIFVKVHPIFTDVPHPFRSLSKTNPSKLDELYCKPLWSQMVFHGTPWFREVKIRVPHENPVTQ